MLFRSEQKSRLFRSFEQAESDTSRKFGGTGLGLAISKRIVEMMGGNIWVESEAGKGSKFIFTVLLEHDAKGEKPLPDEGMNWKDSRIFVVDEDPEILGFFTSFSKIRGISCEVAKSGEEAVERLEKDDKYNIYFIDWELPDMTGVKLVQKIRSKIANKPVVLIHLSMDWQVIEDQARDAGIDKFLPKPLFPSAAVDMINECVGIYNPIRQDNKFNNSNDFSAYSILLAEDIEINREIVLALLEPTLLNVECAENGVRALSLFAAAPEKYDLIFMDIQMPDMDGFEATRNIRALDIPQAKTIPIIAMTANVFHEDIEKCLEAGMDSHVGKPLDFDEVINQLQRYLPEAKNRLNK